MHRLLHHGAPCGVCVINNGPDYLTKCAELEVYHLVILSYFSFDIQFYRNLGWGWEEFPFSVLICFAGLQILIIPAVTSGIFYLSS